MNVFWSKIGQALSAAYSTDTGPVSIAYHVVLQGQEDFGKTGTLCQTQGRSYGKVRYLLGRWNIIPTLLCRLF